MAFVNRVGELAELDQILTSKGSVLYRLVGRRRIGKTALLSTMRERHGGTYLFVPEGDEGRILAELRRQAGEAVGGGVLPPEGWTGLFTFLERFEGKPVVFDEFQHVLEASPTAVSLFQNHWDSRLKTGNHKWFLSGSSIGMMRRLTLGAQGALFGRLTHDRRLRPFRFRDVLLLYDEAGANLRPAQVLERYAVFGGTPHYHGLSLRNLTSIDAAIRASFLEDSSPFREEPLDLLRFELQKPARYHGILEAVGNGKRELEQIRAYLTLDRVGDITRYLGYLRDDLGLLVPDEPVPFAKRTSRYRLEDPFFDFYYRCISRNLSILELGGQDIVVRKIKQELPALTGRAAENVLHQMLIDRNGKTLRGVGIEFERLGRWWGPARGDRTRIVEVDAVAIGRKATVIGEVKWTKEEVGPSIWDNLREKADLTATKNPIFVVVSKSGFSSDCRSQAPAGAVLLDGQAFLEEALAGPVGT